MDRPVKIREVEACRVISMTRVVSIDELDPFMDEAFKALERLAPGDPTLDKASPFVIYHRREKRHRRGVPADSGLH